MTIRLTPVARALCLGALCATFFASAVQAAPGLEATVRAATARAETVQAAFAPLSTSPSALLAAAAPSPMSASAAPASISSLVRVAPAAKALEQVSKASPVLRAPAAAVRPGVQAWLTIDIDAPDNYSRPVLPPHYDAGVLASRNAPADNPITDRGATLGRVLFHDRRLSVNDTVSCASCHAQANGFQALTAVSKGFLGEAGTMHAMRLGNVAFYRGGSMFWDKRAPTLEAQATQPIRNPIEMGYDDANGGMPALLSKMQSLPYYRELFKAVYGDSSITEERIARALSQYMRAMVSAGSRWDRGYALVFDPALPDRGLSRPVPGFTAQENRGKDLFLKPRAEGGAGCAACHRPPTFALDAQAKSNGLDFGETRVFKSPSLKNIAQGRPMMHDGRFTTFEQVLAHYNFGVQDGPALDPRLRTPQGGPAVLNLRPADLAALAAFLGTLDDPALRSDLRFANPFRP